jgi:hypothetical protein
MQAVFQLEPFVLTIYLGTMRLASGSVDAELCGRHDTKVEFRAWMLFAKGKAREDEEEMDFSNRDWDWAWVASHDVRGYCVMEHEPDSSE